MGLTKMNWNNDRVYGAFNYAQPLASTVRRMPQITPRLYQFRFFIQKLLSCRPRPGPVCSRLRRQRDR
ncbi:MAG: hypothetical protein QOJ59_3248 [Thermomicrobiales bacterium]|nr:hypothetical protein [Thermomicrobiales bacterium]